MNLTHTQMTAIERTAQKLQGMTLAILPDDCEDARNIQRLMELVRELRLCSQLLADPIRSHRIAGADRLTGMFDYGSPLYREG